MSNQLAIVIGLIGGLGFGLLASATGNRTLIGFAESVAPIGTAFVNLVRMVVIPLVATTIFSGVAGLGNPKRLGRYGGLTLGFFWATTFIAIIIGMTIMKISVAMFPVTPQPIPPGEGVGELPGAVDFLLSLIPSNPFQVAAEGKLLPLIVFMVLFAAASTAVASKYRTLLMEASEAITATLIKLVHWVLLTAPVGVFALAAPMAATSGWDILKSLAVFVIAVSISLVLFSAAVYIPAAVFLGGVPPKKFIDAVVEPVAIGAGATSSAAALPSMLESAQKELGISKAVAGLVLSLGAAINRAGSALFQGGALIFLAALYDVQIGVPGLIAGGFAVFLASLTVAGVPSASVVTLAPALDVVAVPLSGLSVLFGVDRIPDVIRSAVNVLGHMTTSVFVERFGGRAD
ncbi:MAG: dicarboxylate/amino acid:cation symporter [Gemmatimonadota bacterium]|nr:dicarboxylate/amino acid:cation symporter [Gemmatimonadota bacterium]